ncbi:DUF4153 domain-containing protein [Nocardia sp. NBC_01329]|uniref:DUF4153 domain-containing protein n=1 Tax=Nocardia sp. NBC_01329 TaxID=2903594 RepID=UPI002E109FFB|nr:DUF4173 domain-containing protein [Nocardia sp. NBC_01329]
MPESSAPDGTAERTPPTEPAAETPVSSSSAESADTARAADTTDSAGADATAESPGPCLRPRVPDGPGAAENRIRTPARPPSRHRVAYPAGALTAAATAGLVAAATVPIDRPGIGWLAAGAGVAGAVIAVRRRTGRSSNPEASALPVDRDRLWWALAALALLSVGTFRAAGWLFVLCVAAAAVAGSLAVVGRRSGRGMFRDAAAVPLASFGALAWVYTAQTELRNGSGVRRRRLGVSVAVTLGLLVVFVPLLAGADATFAALVEALMPRMDGDTVARWAVVFLIAGIGSLSAVYLLAGAATGAGERKSSPPRTLTRSEWGLPVGALVAVFAVFVGAQLVALFGGDSYVQRTAGLTYAEYARTGFWQLSTVTVLTLAVILFVLHRAARDSATDRRWLRGLLCAVSVLTLVMVASALGRMWTYQEAYGFTVLRLLVGTCELWLGVVYILVIVAVLRLELAWLPRVTVGTAMAALLALSALNPEGLVAQENIDRWQRGEEIDLDYLAGLSADIVPALDRLPAALRIDLRDQLEYRLDSDTWNSWNLARARAR